MSDNPTPLEQTESEQPLAGMRLAEARRARDISLRDIAKELHLDEAKVRALEENDFAALGAPVFAKGHLRKYAELVGVATDDVLADYYSLNRAAGAPPLLGRAYKPVKDINVGAWVAGFLLVAVIVAIGAGVYWWYEVRNNVTGEPAGSSVLAPFVSEAVQSDADTPATETLAEVPADSEPDDLPGTDNDTFIDPVTPEEAVASDFGDDIQPSNALADKDRVTLNIRFTGDCWTEVSDANGKRLYFELGSAGRNVSVSGLAPLRALFGDSGNVSLSVNGQDYPITDSMRSGRTARMTINTQ